MNKAQEILTENRERLEEITQRLLKEEVLEGDELDELLGYPKKEHHARAIRKKTPRRRTEKRQRKRTAAAPPQSQEDGSRA